MLRAAVFLDRDDTLMPANSLPAPPLPAAPGDVVDPTLVSLLPGVAGACRRLKRAGFTLAVISNQGVIARGGAGMGTVDAVNSRLRELLADPDRPGASLIDAVYYCPYHPRGTVTPYNREHEWRKPGPGMILAAARELQLDLAASWLVGDAERDIQAGLAAGLDSRRCLRIGSGMPLPDLAAAASVILGDRPSIPG